MSNIPTLALIPSAYKTSKVYSVLPSNGDGDFTFSRTTAATRVNKDGLIEDVSADVPRIDYSDSSCPSLLLEPTRTNLLPYSEDFSVSNWSKSASGTGVAPTLTSNYAISPDGTLNASRLQFNKGSGTSSGDWSILNDNATVSSGVTTSKSVYVKSNTSEEYDIIVYGSSSASGTNVKKVRVTSEWQRVDVYKTVSSTLSGISIGLREVGVTGLSDTADVLIWGAQLEQGTEATSYIPTNGSISTRNLDYCNGAGDATLFNDDEGVLFVETKGFIDAPATNGYIQLSKSGESGFDNSLVIQHRNNGALRIYVNGSAGTDLHFNINIDFAQNNKIAVLYKLNGYKLFINGIAQSLSGTPTQNVFSGLDDLSFDLRGSSNWSAKIKDLRYYNTELTDAELIELTTL